MERRDVLKLFGGGLLLVGGGKAVDNVLIGYDENLLNQDLDSLARERFGATERWERQVGDHTLDRDGDRLRVLDAAGETSATLSLSSATTAEAAAVDDELGLAGGPVEQIVADIGALRSGDYVFAFSRLDPFFERVHTADARGFTTDLVRSGWATAPDTVREFTGAAPDEPRAVVQGLMEAFNEHTDYDVPRYLAGSITDNVLFGTVPLRKYFRANVSFPALLDDRHAGMFCYEFTYRSMEALHAVPAFDQRTPVVAGRVHDERHKHVYTAIASVVREDGDLVVPVTFVDYTHTTLYDDFNLTPVLGTGLEAYGDRHRATAIYWD
ncbi:hypothetical protein ACFQH6_13405 [Halobacteriaceae archaeon GCM10025711]